MADPNCPHCNGTGFRILERGGLSAAAECDCSVAERAEKLAEAACIPANYRHATLENFTLPRDNPIAQSNLSVVKIQVSNFAREFPRLEPPPGLLFMGEPGTGKTHLAISVMKQLLAKGHECLFFDYQNLLDRIRAGYDPASGASDREAYRAALDAEVLVLDDLGAHRVTEWVLDTVTSILTYRCNHRKPLIATTNLPDDDIGGPQVEYATASGQKVYRKTLTEVLGPRARSRLFEMCKVIQMPAVEDYRVKHAR